MKKSVRIFSLLIVVSLFFASCEFEVTTASINDIKVCANLNGDLCGQDAPVFHPNDPQIAASCKLKNAPDNTRVTFVWKYVEGEPITIDQVTLNSSDYGINVDMNSRLSKPTNGWPVGKYQVEIVLNDNSDNPQIKEFIVQ